MCNSIFYLTIGPVKSTIVNSRKMRDMYSGSLLLSALMTKAIEKLKSMKNVQIIIPYLEEKALQNQKPNVPNKVIATVSIDNEVEKETLGREIEGLIVNEFKSICNKVFEKCKIKLSEEAEAQLERYLNIYWLFQDSTNYIEDYKKAIEKMQSIKKLRAFNQIDEVPGRKCSLYPDCNAVFYKCNASGKAPSYIDKNSAREIVGDGDKDLKYALKPGESLCAFAFTKRMLHLIDDIYDPQFTSVKSMLLKSRICNFQNCSEIVMEILFGLYAGNEPSEGEYSQNEINEAKNSFEKYKSQKITPYYAVVKLDGDNMGDAYNQCCSIEDQTNLSEKTSKFASAAKEIALNNKGQCIYAGGEDILMFLPIDTLFSAIKDLSEKYSELIGEKHTFSAGIVIAHYHQPLKYVMTKVYEAEKASKIYRAEKNAFAMYLIKRSGESVEIVNGFENKVHNFLIIGKVAKLLCDKGFSHSYIYNLKDNLERLVNRNSDNGGSFSDDMIKAVIVQAYKYKTEDSATNISETIFNLYKSFDDIKRFCNSLNIIDFLSKEGE